MKKGQRLSRPKENQLASAKREVSKSPTHERRVKPEITESSDRDANKGEKRTGKIVEGKGTRNKGRTHARRPLILRTERESKAL